MTASMPRARKSDSISRVFEQLAAQDPQRAVLIWDDRQISIGALLEESRRVAGGLADLGIVAGDRVALWLPNSPAWLALFLAFRGHRRRGQHPLPQLGDRGHHRPIWRAAARPMA